MLDLSSFGVVQVAAAALLIGVSKTGFPGAGILAIPLVAAAMPAKASTGLILPMLIVGDIFAVAYYHRHAQWSRLIGLIPAAMAGVVLGFLALKVVNDSQLKPIIGGIILVMLGLNWWRNRKGEELPVPRAWWFAPAIGLLAGVTTMMANAAGPIMVIYLLAMRLPKEQFIGTGAWYFLLLNCFKVPFSGDLGLITTQSLTFNLLMAPLIVGGAFAGIYMLRRVPQRGFTAAMQVLAAAGAAYLLF